MSEEVKEVPITETPIVIIDDESSVRTVAKRSLERYEKFKNITTHDGADGLVGKWISSGNMPSLILCDVMMPDKNGPEFIKELWEACQETGKNFPKIIFMSGFQPEGVKQQIDALSKKVGIGEFPLIAKPFRPKEMASTVKETL